MDPTHKTEFISGTRWRCTVCDVEWLSGPYWEIDGRFWTSRATYESWALKENAGVDPNRRDITSV